MNGQVLLAVDGGNSKTDLALVGADGRLLALARGPLSSPHHIGLDGCLAVLERLLERALHAALLWPVELPVAVAQLLLAGVDFPSEEQALDQALAGRGWARRVVVGNDTFAVLRAGTERYLRWWEERPAFSRTYFVELPSAETVFARAADAELVSIRVWPTLEVLAIFRPWASDGSSIDFDVDLTELQGQERLDVFCRFLTTIGRELGKPVLMSPEADWEHPVLGFDPTTDRVVLLAEPWGTA